MDGYDNWKLATPPEYEDEDSAQDYEDGQSDFTYDADR